jgi:MFS transporter, DHA1 family, inner membrane transport protein
MKFMDPRPPSVRRVWGELEKMASLTVQITLASLCRVLLNTARRFPYPFAPALSRGLQVPLPAVTSLIAVNQVTGLLSLLFGPLADRWGYRSMLLAGLGFLSAGMLGGGLFPYYGVILIGLFLAGLGKSSFDPALLAYVGERVPFRRRGLFVGLMETAWAASTLVGVPLIGFLIARMGWRAPFFAIGFLALLGLGALALLTHSPGVGKPGNKAPFAMIGAWKKFAMNRPALGIVGFSFFISMANDNFFVVYGAWMEQAFHLSVIALGLTTSVIGGAELLGEGLTASLGDRLGLRRSMTIGLILSTGSYLLLPLLEASLPGAVGALFSIFLFTEFAIVAALSLSTEAMPEARATMMSGYLAAASLGRVFGALMGGFVWSLGGLSTVAFVSASINALALLSFLWGIRSRALRRS